jgi:hypothetical protein
MKHHQCITATSLRATAIRSDYHYKLTFYTTIVVSAPTVRALLDYCIYIYTMKDFQTLRGMNDCLSWSASTLLGELCLCRLPLQDYISSYRPTHTPIYMSSAFCFKIVSKPAASEKEIKTCAESEGSWSRRISASPFSKTFAFSQLDLVTSALVNSRRCL